MTTDSEGSEKAKTDPEIVCIACGQPVALEHGCENPECMTVVSAKLKTALLQTPFRIGV